MLWHQALEHCHKTAQPYVLLTLLSGAGSTPRDMGSKMLVTADTIYDTIGGGHLEHKAIATARELLASSKTIQHVEHYPLASKLGQCCGGATNVLFEVFNLDVQYLYLFGAGHVAQALVPIISQLPMQIYWLDSRQSCFNHTQSYDNVHKLVDDDLLYLIDEPKPNSWMLVMTHDHQLDFELVHYGITHESFDFVGMIGSQTKARRFNTRLTNQGANQAQLNKLVCPVGNLDVPGKRPIEVAVSIASQFIAMLNPQKPDNGSRAQWQKTKQIAKLL